MTDRVSALVTGSTGFVGSHLLPRLIEDNWQVTVVVRSTSSTGELPEGVGVIVDSGDIDQLTADIAKVAPSVCFHLATNFVGVHTPADVQPMIEANVAFGGRLLEALSALDDVTVINVGTVWQHYEGREYGPTSLYAATKEAFCDILRFYAECTSVKAATIELTDTYGPNDKRKKLLPMLVETANTQTPLLMSKGEQVFDIIHIDDVVEAILTTVELASHDAPSFSINSEAPRTLKGFVELVGETIGKTVPVEWGARPYRPREMMELWAATPPLPGWAPKVSLEEGLRQVLVSKES